MKKIKYSGHRLIILIFCLIFTLVLFSGSKGPHKETTMTQTQTATFAGGCFWCTASAFDGVKGVKTVTSGYMGGHVDNPSYEHVCTGDTGHAEVVQITFDPKEISYEDLLARFFQQIDPTDENGSFVDRGSQYRPAVFYHSEEQQKQALEMVQRINDAGIFKDPVATQVVEAVEFFPAETYHQDYHKKNPTQYKFYRVGSGRQGFISRVWNEKNQKILRPEKPADSTAVAGEEIVVKTDTVPTDEVLKERLTPLQYNVTRKNATEPPFENAFWNNTQEGIYVDIISGEPLFSSRDKFDSGCGWPSFTRPIEDKKIVEKEDNSLFMTRTEVRSKTSDAHLGHVFDDGPGPTGLRYCINSASLKFIPKDALADQGYGHLEKLFEKESR